MCVFFCCVPPLPALLSTLSGCQPIDKSCADELSNVLSRTVHYLLHCCSLILLPVVWSTLAFVPLLRTNLCCIDCSSYFCVFLFVISLLPLFRAVRCLLPLLIAGSPGLTTFIFCLFYLFSLVGSNRFRRSNSRRAVYLNLFFFWVCVNFPSVSGHRLSFVALVTQ